MTGHRVLRGGRASDERLLQWLAARAAGMSYATIGSAYGVHPGQVSRDVSQVIDADIRESGESAAAMIAGYPWRDFGPAARADRRDRIARQEAAQ